MKALKHDPSRTGAIVPRGGAGRGLSDLFSAMLRGLLQFGLWFVAGGRTPQAVVARRRMSGVVVVRVGLVLLFALFAYTGMMNPALTGFSIAIVLLVAMYGFVARSYARDRLFVAATRELQGTTPLGPATVSAPSVLSARALQRLALGVDRIRRGDAQGARAVLVDLEEELLEPDERRMLAAVRALAASAMADHKLAGMLAISGFPTGAPSIDEPIGRLCFESCFHDGTRLHAMLDAWSRAGLDPGDAGPLPQIQRLAMLKLNRLDPATLPAAERRAAAEYARALGDRELEKTLLNVEASAGEGSSRYR